MEFAKWLGQTVFDVVGGGWAGAAGDVVDGSLVDLQVGKTVFHGAPARMRTELYLSQVRGAQQAGAAMC